VRGDKDNLTMYNNFKKTSIPFIKVRGKFIKYSSLLQAIISSRWRKSHMKIEILQFVKNLKLTGE